MLITKTTPPLPKKMPPPKLKWQKKQFSGTQEFRFHLPYAFLLLCKLWDITPDDLLHDFMYNLSCGSWEREGKEVAKAHLKSYILEAGYGQQHYTKEDIQQMFEELECIGSLWPQKAKIKMIETHARWRDEYYNWWFKKWNKKYHRKPS